MQRRYNPETSVPRVYCSPRILGVPIIYRVSTLLSHASRFADSRDASRNDDSVLTKVIESLVDWRHGTLAVRGVSDVDWSPVCSKRSTGGVWNFGWTRLVSRQLAAWYSLYTWLRCMSCLQSKYFDPPPPPPPGLFLFTMFPDQEPGGRGPPSKHLVQILQEGSSSCGFLIWEHSK